jgi:cytochrome c-type biogenesis protein CcmE
MVDENGVRIRSRLVWENGGRSMDPSRKRAIRLTVALTAALLLASALIYTSFSAGREELTASQLMRQAKPGRSYILAGTVVDGSVSHAGPALLFRVRDPKLHMSVPVRYTGEVPDPFRPRGAGHGAAAGDGVHRTGEFAHDQMPVEVPGCERR